MFDRRVEVFLEIPQTVRQEEVWAVLLALLPQFS